MFAVPILVGVAALLLVAVVGHLAALRRYESLLEDGRIAGREARFSLTWPRRRPRQPGEFRFSLSCAAPFTVSMERESLATGFEKAIGIRHDRATGDEELDRLFSFRFDDRARFRACLEGAGLKRIVLILADLGVRSIRVEDGWITVCIPLRLLLPPRLELVRQVVDRVVAAATSVESAHGSVSSVERFESHRDSLQEPRGFSEQRPEHDAAPFGRRRLTLPLTVAVFLVAVAFVSAIAIPMWERGLEFVEQELLTQMQVRLFLAVFAAAGVGYLVGRLAGGPPPLWGIGLSWPMFFYSTVMWAYYFIFVTADAPFARNYMADSAEIISQVLMVLTAAPLLLLVSGWIGARWGCKRHTSGT